MPILFEKRKSLSQTSDRLQYVTHVLQTELDEIESALTEEDQNHPNIKVMADMLKRLSVAQAEVTETIKLLA